MSSKFRCEALQQTHVPREFGLEQPDFGSMTEPVTEFLPAGVDQVFDHEDRLVHVYLWAVARSDEKCLQLNMLNKSSCDGKQEAGQATQAHKPLMTPISSARLFLPASFGRARCD